MLRRWLHPVLRYHPPRGVGTAGATLLILFAAAYGAIMGGHGPIIRDNLQAAGDAVANALGFRISEVALAGQHEVTRQEVLSHAGISESSSLLFLDPARTRERLLTDPWIAQATVLKLYPSRLRIDIKERKPFALWQEDGRISVISADGRVLDDFVPERFASLPRVVGHGAGQKAKRFLAMISRYPDIAQQMEAAVLVADRRWDLHLKDGVEILLPEAAPEHALQALLELDRDKKLLSRDIVAVDLRLADRVTVRLSDAAAAAREQALKAAEKAAKKNKKGGEA